MHEFSTVDGFMELTESLAEMIKYIANEPSVGLFYVQQHTQNAVPNVLNLRNNLIHKSREMTLHTEDLEDCVTMVSSMKECGLPIAEEMIKDIKKSLTIMSTKQPKRGSLHSPSSDNQFVRTSSWSPATWGRSAFYSQTQTEVSSSLFSVVLKSAKEKASNIKWPQLESKETRHAKTEEFPLYTTAPSVIASATTSALRDTEDIDLPLSSQIADGLQEEPPVDDSLSSQNLVLLSGNYEEFKADREAKLEEWLAASANEDRGPERTNATSLDL